MSILGSQYLVSSCKGKLHLCRSLRWYNARVLKAFPHVIPAIGITVYKSPPAMQQFHMPETRSFEYTFQASYSQPGMYHVHQEVKSL